MEQLRVEEASLPGSGAVAGHSDALATALDPGLESAVVTATATRADTAREEISRHSRRHQRAAGVTVAGLSLFTVLFTAMVQWLVRVHSDDPAFWTSQFPILTATNLGFLLLTSAGLLWSNLKTGRTVHDHARLLVREADKQSVGAFVDLLRFDTLDAQRTAKASLTKLLPALRASDAHLLDARQRGVLNRLLAVSPKQVGTKDIRELFEDTTGRETAIRVAILMAYRQIGTADALPIVERLAESAGGTPAELRIKDAAVECLPFLRIRAGQQSAQSSLLRGSSAASQPDSTLLRAAVSQESSPEDLLRAAPAAVDPP